VQQAEQHGSGGEGGEEMEINMREILLGVGFGSGGVLRKTQGFSWCTAQESAHSFGSAPAPTAL
jgi:hypothetical protein